MITLLTAAPGGGKSAYAVGVMMRKAEEEGRPIFSMGIPGLLIPHVPVVKIEEWVELRPSPESPDIVYPYFSFPEGAIVFIDEAQRIYPTRPNGSKVPNHVAAFETHRHTGIDIVLMTQHPQLVDNHVRKIVGRHIHIRDVGILGRWFYEWPEATDPSQYRTAPVKKKYSLPRRAFSLYKSSSKHIKPTRSIPPVFVALVVAVIAFAALGYRFYTSLDSKTNPAPAPREAAGKVAQVEEGAIVLNTPEKLLTETIPLVPDRPETAPIYDALRVAKQMPEIVGCVRHENACDCFTQQGTRAPVSAQYCDAWMTGRRPFNPYKEPPQQVASTEPQQPQQMARAPVVVPAGTKPPPGLNEGWKPPFADMPASSAATTPPQPMQGSPMQSGLSGQPG